MKTIMFDGKECVAASVAFNKESENWLEKLVTVMRFAAHGGIIRGIVIKDRLTDEVVKNPWFVESKQYGYGIFKFLLPLSDLEKYKEDMIKTGIKYGPARRGDIPELDKIFNDIEDASEPISQAG